MTAIVVLLLALLGLGAAYAYSTNSAEQWRAASEARSRDLSWMTSDRDSLSEKNKSLTAQLSDATSKLTDMTDQYNQTNDRVRSLANEKAQVGDAAAELAQLVASSQKVTGELSTCISDLQKLQTYLVNASAYDQTSLLNLVRGINSECNTARGDSDSLTKTIQGLGK